MRVVSLFSGAGGLDLGFVKAGFEIVWAIDNFQEAVDTYRHNIGDHIVCGDITEVDTSNVPSADVIIGGFPCQGFSVANMKRSEKDGRNALYLEFIRFLKALKPRFFLAENVKGILSLGKGKVFEQIREDFTSAGYDVSDALLNAANYGVPQKRQRVFILGVRKDLPCDLTHFPPKPTHAQLDKCEMLGLLPWVGSGEALKDIPEPEDKHNLENHVYTKYKLRFNGYIGHREIDPKLPSPTITARGDSRGGVVILHHPNNHRRMSVRETAIIQSFPVDYFFCGSRTSAYRQVGNAVPPLLAYHVAKALLGCCHTDVLLPLQLNETQLSLFA
jgi:DNA (cytosine-5)-methyltransferase 1